MRTIIVLALALTGCAPRYVAVEIQRDPPKPPAECFVPRERVAPMRPIPTGEAERSKLCGTSPLSVCVSGLWAKHVTARDAADARAEARRRVCAAHHQG